MDLPEFRKKFARRVRTLRTERGWTQEHLEEFGLAWKTIQKLESGTTDPKVSTLLKLSKAFGVSLNDLISGLD